LKPLLTSVVLFFLFESTLYAAWTADTSITNGSWNNPAIWKTGKVPNDTDNVVINTTVLLTQNVTLRYLEITTKGSLCGDFSLYGTFQFFGPVSCKSITFNGPSNSTSNVIVTDQITATQSGFEFVGSYCVNIGTGVPASCGSYTVPQANFTSSTVCANQPITFEDKSSGSFLCIQWLFPGGSPSSSNLEDPTVIYNSPGYYTVILIASNPKGTDTLSRTIYINPLPDACCNSTITIGQSIQLNTINSISCTWVPSSGLNCTNCCNPIASPDASTTYLVSMISDSGCRVTNPITIDVNCNVFIPKAFSPNDDGQNDKLYVRGDCINSIDFIIFDRYGNKVFETNNKNIPWDGTYRGEPMNEGTYVYYMSATMYDGISQTQKGSVELIR